MPKRKNCRDITERSSKRLSTEQPLFLCFIRFCRLYYNNVVMKWLNDLLGKKIYTGKTVDLKHEYTRSPSSFNNYIPSVIFGIYEHGTSNKAGEIDLRLGMDDELYYAGQVGYRIYENYRGHRYAYYACRMIFQIAHDEYHMDELLITCSPENTPSRLTLEQLGGVFKENTDVPEWHWLYKRGEKNKNIYVFPLN